ncbi:MAG: hypothetical protein NT069_34715 [Planctomycetota bacterium]|nr:hypothetical protein [Planctomycetota bacterium]
MPFDHSVYFYTYSTIAQTLAGAFGFLVAAVVFRIQAISARVAELAEQVIQHSPADPQRLRQIRVDGNWAELISLHAGNNQFNARLSKEQNELMDLQFQQIRHGVLLLERIREALFASLYSTGPVILFSIAAMPITSFWLDPRSPVAVLCLTLAILSAAFCLWSYFRLMINVFAN